MFVDVAARFEVIVVPMFSPSPIVADIPRSDDIIRYEDMGKTVVEGDPGLDVSKRFLALAQLLLDEEKASA